MAKPYDERFKSMFKSGARATDVEAMIRETDALITATRTAGADATSRAQDPHSSDDDAASDRDEAAGHAFAVERLTVKLERLKERHEQLTNSERARSNAALYHQVAEETANLADELKERVPAIFAELVDLFDRIEKNDTLVAQANAVCPGGSSHLLSAELVARGLSGHHWPPGNVVPVDRLTKIKLPRFETWGHCWPIDRQVAERIALDEAQHRQRVAAKEAAKPEVIAAKAAAHAARFKRYSVEQASYAGHPTGPVRHRGGAAMIYNEPSILELDESQVAAARTQRMKVTAAPPEFQAYEVAHARGNEGYSATIDTRDGPTDVGGQPINVIMNARQAEMARSSCIVQLVSSDENIGAEELA